MAKNSNLHLLVESTVSKIIIEGGKATGVEYVPTVAAEGTAPPRHTVKARKLVVLSAGSISSPRVLERSGVGAKAILEAVGITPIVDLPGVGSNYQDHLLCSSWYQVTDDTETPDDLFRLDPSALLKAEEGWPKGEGALTSNFMDVGSKIRPTDAEVASLGPDFQKYWKEKFENAKDKAAVLTCWAMGYIPPSIPNVPKLTFCTDMSAHTNSLASKRENTSVLCPSCSTQPAVASSTSLQPTRTNTPASTQVSCHILQILLR